MSNSLLLTGIEVRGQGLPAWYRTYQMGSIPAILYRSNTSSITLYSQTPSPRDTVIILDNSSGIIVEEGARLIAHSRRRVHRLFGAVVDETVSYAVSANSNEEVGELLMPYIEYYALNFHAV